MTRMTMALALAGTVAAASTLRAQGAPPAGRMGGMGGPGAPMMHGQPGGPQGMHHDAASMLLSHTADLKLTDAQVTRLAAIARRAGDRHTAMRSMEDSMHAAMMKAQAAAPSTPNAPPPQMPAAARTMMEKMHASEHEDLRDALSVLTPDQLATAFETMTHGGPMRQMPGMMREQGPPPRTNNNDYGAPRRQPAPPPRSPDSQQ